MKHFVGIAVLALTLVFCPGARSDDAQASRPVVAVLAYNQGTEVTDFLVPFGILADSRLVEVHAVALAKGPVTMLPAPGEVELPGTAADFDAAHPGGADFVIVPAVVDPNAAALTSWLRAQHAKGAVVMSICEGAKVLAEAGLLKDRTATSHWYYLKQLRRKFPETTWRDDRRYVFDGSVATTSGVSASVPATFALLERIAGAEAVAEYAASVGVATWTATHDGAAFARPHTPSDGVAGVRPRSAVSESAGLGLSDGFDEARAALVMDAYSRTHRSKVVLHSGDSAAIRSRHGLVFRTNRDARTYEIDEAVLQAPLGHTLDATLNRIERDYGTAAADHVANQLEYVRARADATTPH